MKATEDVLNKLHGQVAINLISAVTDDEVSPAMMAQAIKFLKDNDITASIADDENMSSLAEELKKKRENRKLRIVQGE